MTTLTIQTPRTQIALQSERLVVTPPPSEGDTSPPAEVPLAELERAVLGEGVLITTPALCALMERAIPVLFLRWNGRPLGSFEPPGPPRGATRILQYQLASTPDPALRCARQLVTVKISNQRRLLQRLNSNHHRLSPGVLEELATAERAAQAAVDLPALIGLEGAAAARYFAGWALFLPEDQPFGGRSTRPPRNPVNACLSYLSALVYGELLSACLARGLDPALGCLHQSTDDRWSLPLDLMEPFRPVLLEALTLWLFSHRALRQPHFEAREGGVWLNGDGRRILLEHYEQRVRREFFSEHAGSRTNLRQQFRQAAVDFKLALTQPETLRPFRLN
jgi:CRISPR-associated protein Cas1